MPALGTFGLWLSGRIWPKAEPHISDAAKLIESLGFTAVWLGSSAQDLAIPERILASTSTLVAATGIVNIWQSQPEVLAASHDRVTSAHPDRLLLGIGVGHRSMNESYQRPLAKLETFLDDLDAAVVPVPRRERIVAALGPRMLALAAARTLGSHPYLVPPEHTAAARGALGPSAVLAPEQKVLFCTDASEARRVARAALTGFLRLRNYVENLRRLGLEDEDFSGNGSDRFVDTTVAWGDESAVRRRLDEHLAAGANHVAVQVLSTRGSSSLPVDDWRRLADIMR